MSAPSRPYLSNGQVLSSPPLTARVNRFFDNAYTFLGLYFVSLFSFDPYAAAESSRFNSRNNPNAHSNRPRWGGSGGSGGGRGPGGGGPGSGGGSGGSGKRIGRVDDVRAPECGSCR